MWMRMMGCEDVGEDEAEVEVELKVTALRQHHHVALAANP